MDENAADQFPKVPNRKETPERIRRAIYRASLTGRPFRQIARDLGVSHRTVVKDAAPRTTTEPEPAEHGVEVNEVSTD